MPYKKNQETSANTWDSLKTVPSYNLAGDTPKKRMRSGSTTDNTSSQKRVRFNEDDSTSVNRSEQQIPIVTKKYISVRGLDLNELPEDLGVDEYGVYEYVTDEINISKLTSEESRNMSSLSIVDPANPELHAKPIKSAMKAGASFPKEPVVQTNKKENVTNTKPTTKSVKFINGIEGTPIEDIVEIPKIGLESFSSGRSVRQNNGVPVKEIDPGLFNRRTTEEISAERENLLEPKRPKLLKSGMKPSARYNKNSDAHELPDILLPISDETIESSSITNRKHVLPQLHRRASINTTRGNDTTAFVGTEIKKELSRRNLENRGDDGRWMR